jgi:hypothetical protein
MYSVYSLVSICMELSPIIEGVGGFNPFCRGFGGVQTPSVEGFGGFKPGVQKVFEEVPIRTELANMPLVVSVEGAPEKEGNYIVVKGKRKHAEIHMRDYKTRFTYGDRVYALAPSLSQT